MSTHIDFPACAFDEQAALAALHRAAAMARKIAIDTDTPLVVVRDGKVVHIPAAQLRQQASVQESVQDEKS